MFCESCGTVLDVNSLCVNCDKKRQDKNIDSESPIELKLDIAG
ncbi:MAG: hypothetical protein ACFFAE_22415 [Candidatus Hodarchaeota archaeon]